MTAQDVQAPSLDDVRAARARIRPHLAATPLVRLDAGERDAALYLKLENLQPIGSFKVRGALSRMLDGPPEELDDGVYTASAGNMAQGVAWAARALRLRGGAAVVVPDSAPRAKLDALARLGAAIEQVPFAEWWDAMRNHGHPRMRGTFVHPFADRRVMAGNGTIALEILEELPDVSAILVPWGGGGLTCGIAAAVRALRPAVAVYACEVATAAPLTASLAKGAPATVEHSRSFVDGIGGPSLFPEMWPLARSLVADALTVSVEQAAAAVRLLAERAHVVAEGAGAVPLAAALASPRLRGHVVCIVSGGNIDSGVLAGILSGSAPQGGTPPA